MTGHPVAYLLRGLAGSAQTTFAWKLDTVTDERARRRLAWATEGKGAFPQVQKRITRGYAHLVRQPPLAV